LINWGRDANNFVPKRSTICCLHVCMDIHNRFFKDNIVRNNADNYIDK
jgi:hypothetical protein